MEDQRVQILYNMFKDSYQPSSRGWSWFLRCQDFSRYGSIMYPAHQTLQKPHSPFGSTTVTLRRKHPWNIRFSLTGGSAAMRRSSRVMRIICHDNVLSDKPAACDCDYVLRCVIDGRHAALVSVGSALVGTCGHTALIAVRAVYTKIHRSTVFGVEFRCIPKTSRRVSHRQ